MNKSTLQNVSLFNRINNSRFGACLSILYVLIFLCAAQNAFSQAACVRSQVLINEIYTEGGLTGAAYKNDFVELYNTTGTTCNLTNFSIQVATGNANNFPNVFAFPTGSIIQASGFFLIQFGSGGTAGANLPSPDFTAAVDLSSSGKIALVNNPASLSGNCASNLTNAFDFVGYGSTNCFLGAGAASAGTVTQSVQRTTNGANTNNNNVDFVLRAASPRNTLPPTAASVTISGRVTNSGTGISNVILYLTNQNGELKTARTNSFGFFNFKDVTVGETYVITAFSKCCSFNPQVISVYEDISEISFETTQ